MSVTSHAEHGRFATTHWSLVHQLQGPDAASALAALCEQYWIPLYVFARRELGHDEDARDATQAFFAWLLAKDLFRRAAADRGRLRSFLLTSLKNFLSNERQARRRKIRGGGATFLSLNFDDLASPYLELPADSLTPERQYERSWALVLLDRVMRRLAGELEAEGQGERFRALKPALAGGSGVSYGPIATQLGLTEVAVRQAASRLRKRYRQLLLTEVRATVADPEDVDEEIGRLFQALGPA